MDKVEEQIGTKEALTIAQEAGIQVTPPTLRSWCVKFKLGHQLGTGKWSIYKNKYIDFLNGKKEANNGK